MGHAKRTQERRKDERKRANPLYPTWMPPECWEVRGTSQHGDEIDFRVATQEEADRHAERLNRLGAVAVKRLVWNSPAAAYRDARD